MNISHYGFDWPVNFSNENKIQEKEFILRNKQILSICELFANTSHLTNIIPIPIYKFWNSQTIPIQICTEIGSANLFLFPFAGKITIR